MFQAVQWRQANRPLVSKSSKPSDADTGTLFGARKDERLHGMTLGTRRQANDVPWTGLHFTTNGSCIRRCDKPLLWHSNKKGLVRQIGLATRSLGQAIR